MPTIETPNKDLVNPFSPILIPQVLSPETKPPNYVVYVFYLTKPHIIH